MATVNQLSNIDVNFISIVKKGANGKEIIWKSADADTDTPELKRFDIKKIDEEKHVVYGIVYSPGEVDSQGDMATAEEIEKAAYAFMKNARIDKVDDDHDYDPDVGFVGETWLTKENDSIFPDEPTGSWAVGIKVENDETWALVKSGEYNGLSMAGSANRSPVEKGFFSRLKDLFTPNMEKDFNSEYRWEVIYDAVDALWASIWDAIYDKNLTGDQRKAQLQTNFDQFLAALDGETLVLKSDDDEEETMTNEEVQEVVDTRLDEKLKPIQASLEKLEKAQTDDADASDDDDAAADEFTKEDFEALQSRIEALEKGTNGSAQPDGQDDDDVEKSKGIKFV